MFGGWLSDKLLKATGSANLGRKLPIVTGLLMASCIITANWLQSDGGDPVMSFAFLAGDGGPRLDADLRYRPEGAGRSLPAACLTSAPTSRGSSPRW